jgi:iron complex outermembrane receptor protein
MRSRTTAGAAVGLAASLMAQEARAQAAVDPLVVTGTRLPTEASRYPGMVTVLDGRDLEARGATTLRDALELVAGVDAPPGGDAGPAGAVPAFWGLQEFDAFLLVVDGVPVGGAFNPAIATLDIRNVERIEVLRGSAPVTYGATSFVGVIQVFHYAAGAAPQETGASVGAPGLGSAWLSANLPALGAFAQTIFLDAGTSRFAQDRSRAGRGHILYRTGGDTPAGRLRLDLDGVLLRQDPYSPHPREGSGLSPRFPLDANINPTDARADQSRLQVNLGLDRDLDWGAWSTTATAAYTDSRNTRGFLRADFAEDGVTPNADGFRQTVRQTDLYIDTHLVVRSGKIASWVFGADWLYGDGRQDSENFEYAVLPDGRNAPPSTLPPVDESTSASDRRSFAGLYALGQWTPTSRWLVSGGVRLNLTNERRRGEVVDEHASPGEPADTSGESRSRTRLSGEAGVSYVLWRRGKDRLAGFGNFRDTFKPAAVDFGPEGEGGILNPETARSWEGGMKGVLGDGALEWEASVFRMDFENLVIRENINGLPAMANAGSERFTGGEIEARWRISARLSLFANHAWHRARFLDYRRLRPDGSVQQLDGKDLELSPRRIGGVGLLYRSEQGLQASAVARYVGARFLDKSNTISTPGYTTIDTSVGYAAGAWTLRAVGENLTDRRAPVAESELGDAQFYRLPGRTVRLELSRAF